MRSTEEVRKRLEAYRVDRDGMEDAFTSDAPYASAFGSGIRDLDARIEELEWALGEAQEPSGKSLSDVTLEDLLGAVL